jgi:hypothetical protein
VVLTLFEERESKRHHIASFFIWKDTAMLLFIIFPLFIIGLRFWTAPTYLKYSLKINALTGPLGLIPSFFAYHGDVKAMGAIVLFMNLYVFWYHADPPYEGNYGTSFRRDSDEESDEVEIDRSMSSERFTHSIEKGAELVKHMSMAAPHMQGMAAGFGGGFM